ncbi:hypothetical protein V8U06_13430 [Shinella sp. G-2]
MISTLTASSTAAAPAKMLRYGTHKTASAPSTAGEKDIRKRTVAGKMTVQDGPGVDLACLPAQTVLRLHAAPAAIAMVLPFRSGTGSLDTRGARAPPPIFA